ncbi:DinB family protein [Galbibacter mesophilus]|uniref:DinB family protein n=1 Tax=Galbibacter mesophilus TaxID=379069 RepID=UPI00191D14E2|nr:DinB family protein [Galbibacter mesophilus]MCM5663639.1 DinB family protein [Galbibacter mesophilus]
MRTNIISDFRTATTEFVELLHSLSEKQLNSPTSGNDWTAGQIGDHILKSYNVMTILHGPIKPTSRDPYEKLPPIIEMFADDTIKMEAPAEVVPESGYIHKEKLIKGLQERIAEQNEVLENEDLRVLCTAFKLPGSEDYFTRLEWLGFNLVHTQRHIRQLKRTIETIKNPNQ